jgi:hypothetical protein
MEPDGVGPYGQITNPTGSFEALVADFVYNAKVLAAGIDQQVIDLTHDNARLRAALKAIHMNTPRSQVQSDDEVQTPSPMPFETVLGNSVPVKDSDGETAAKYVVSEAIVQDTLRSPADVSKSPAEASAMPSSKSEDGRSSRASKNQLTTKQARAAMQALDFNPHLKGKDDPQAAGRKKRGMFTDVDEMKKQVRTAILKPYDVSMYYKPLKSSLCARIAVHDLFEATSLAVVAVNSLWLSIDIDLNGSTPSREKHVAYQIIEYVFFAWFVAEILVRFGAFKWKCDCVKDFWFNFDASLVLLMTFDTLLPLVASKGFTFNTSILRLARLVKITRMGRIARVLKRWPELSVMLQGMGIACRSVVSTVIFLIIMVYVFAVAFRYLTIDTAVGNKYFESVPAAMFYLGLFSTMPDALELANATGRENFLITVVVIIFVCVSTLTLLNMLIGVLCEVIGVVAAMEKEESRVHVVKDHLLQVLCSSGIDANADGFINKSEFQSMLLNASVVRVLREVGVDPVGLIDFIDYIFASVSDEKTDRGLTFDKLVELIVELGGTNKATVKDVVDMRQVVIRQLANIEDILENHLTVTSGLIRERSTFQAPAPPVAPSSNEAPLSSTMQTPPSVFEITF